jgi:hypothetical protein
VGITQKRLSQLKQGGMIKLLFLRIINFLIIADGRIPGIRYLPNFKFAAALKRYVKQLIIIIELSMAVIGEPS